MDHASQEEVGVAQTAHTMRTILTKCISTRCARLEVACACRYKINLCEGSELIAVFQEGDHTMVDEHSASPREPKMTAEMKDYVNNKLDSNSTMTSHVLFT